MDPLDETRSTYERHADAYYDRHTDRSVVAEQVESFRAALPRQGRVADLGCGPGWEAATFVAAGHEVVALDLTWAFLDRTGTVAPDAHRVRGDMRALPIATGVLDGLWACASFLHVPREDAVPTLREFARTLRPDGVCHLSVHRGEGTRSGQSYEGDDRRFTLWTAEGLRAAVEDAGLAVEMLRTDGNWLWGLVRPPGP